jgi:hypothetical protein
VACASKIRDVVLRFATSFAIVMLFSLVLGLTIYAGYTELKALEREFSVARVVILGCVALATLLVFALFMVCVFEALKTR